MLLYHIIPGQLRSSDVTSSIIRGPVLPEVGFWCKVPDACFLLTVAWTICDSAVAVCTPQDFVNGLQSIFANTVGARVARLQC